MPWRHGRCRSSELAESRTPQKQDEYVSARFRLLAEPLPAMLNLDDLSPSEQKLFAAVETGGTVSLAQGDAGSALDPRSSTGWSSECTVRAWVLAALLCDAQLPHERTARAISLHDARIDGVLDLEGRRLRCPLLLENCYLNGFVTLAEAHASRVRFHECRLSALIAPGLTTTGDLAVTNSRLDWMSVQRAKVGGRLDLSGTRLSDFGSVLYGDDLHVASDLLLRWGFQSTGEIALSGAHVQGQLNLSGADLTSVSGSALAANKIRVDQDIWCDDHTTVEGPLVLSDGKIGGSLELAGASFSCPYAVALWADRLEISRNLRGLHGLRVNGEILASGAQIGGQVIVRGATLSNPGGRALTADGLRTIGDVHLVEQCAVKGTVSFAGAQIGGQVVFSQLALSAPDGLSAVFDNARITEDLMIREGCLIEGEVRLHGTHIGGGLSFHSATVSNTGGTAIRAPRLVVDGTLSGAELIADGAVDMIGAEVKGQLNLSSAELRNPTRLALDLERAKVGHLVLPFFVPPSGVVDLTNAQIGIFHDDWARARYAARLNGLRYEALTGGTRGLADRLKWLSSAADGYLRQPYEQLAKVYRAEGQDDDARSVAYAKLRRQRSQRGLVGKCLDWFVCTTVGYGYRPWRAFLWLLGVVVLGAMVFGGANHRGEIVSAHEPGVSTTTFHAWLYALDSILPVINLGQKDNWVALNAAEYWYAFSVVAGWVLISVLVASLTRRLVRD